MIDECKNCALIVSFEYKNNINIDQFVVIPIILHFIESIGKMGFQKLSVCSKNSTFKIKKLSNLLKYIQARQLNTKQIKILLFKFMTAPSLTMAINFFLKEQRN